jgi:hypothetical protein
MDGDLVISGSGQTNTADAANRPSRYGGVRSGAVPRGVVDFEVILGVSRRC